MAQTPSYYVNSPTSGTQYNSPYKFKPTGGTWTVTVKSWSGANGGGSLVTSQNLTAYNRDVTTSTNLNSLNGGTANTTNVSTGSSTDICTSGGSFSGGSAPGSLEIYAVYTGTAVASAYVNTGTPGSPVWTAASEVDVNTGTPGSPVWTQATDIDVNTGTPGSPVWTPGA